MSPQLAAELLEIIRDLYDGSESELELGRQFGRANAILSRFIGQQLGKEPELSDIDYLELTSEDASK